MIKTIRSYGAEFIGILVCLTLGMASGYIVNTGHSSWYLGLNKPIFNPPNWVFPITWGFLYALMGVVLGKIWKIRNYKPKLLACFIFQFIFNLLWSPLFFYFHKVEYALYDLILLWISLLYFMVLSLKIRHVFLLMIPYFLWVSFALLLNFSIYFLN